MKVLFITSAPIFPTNSGYKQSVLGRIHDYVVEGAEVEVIELDNELVDAPVTVPPAFAGVKLHRVVNDIARSVKQELAALLSRKPRYATLFGNARMRALCADIISRSQPDVIFAESLWTISVVPAAFASRATLVIHDVAQHFFSEMARTTPNLPRRILFAIDCLKIREFENYCLRQHTGNFMFLTAEDLAWYSAQYRLEASRLSVAENRLYVRELKREVDVKDPFILFPGSLDFAQNYFAMKWFVDQVQPRITNSKPLKLVITGKCSKKIRRDFVGHDRIRFVGEVSREELDRLFASCLCVISPIISGTGIKIKILEATQRGVPVIATATSARGIESELCFKSPKDTAESYAATFDRSIAALF